MRGPGWPDARGWIGLGVFTLTVMVFVMLYTDHELRKDEFFKTMGTLIVGTAFVGGVVAWAYGSTKSGGELAQRNADTVDAVARAAPAVQPVTVVNPPDDPVQVETAS